MAENAQAVTVTAAYFVATITEEGLENVLEFETIAEARAYCAGFSEGCSHYGGDNGMAFVLPRDEADMLEAIERHEWRSQILQSLREKGVPLSAAAS